MCLRKVGYQAGSQNAIRLAFALLLFDCPCWITLLLSFVYVQGDDF